MDNFVAIHADVSQRLVLHQRSFQFMDLHVSGISWRFPGRTGVQTNWASSSIAYLPDSAFHRQIHDFGEGILVLDGIFCDENGDYKQGCYFKNLPGSTHAPWSGMGSVSFVKFSHLDPADEQQLAFDTRPGQWPLRLVPGPAVLPLSSLGTHNAAVVRCAPARGSIRIVILVVKRFML